MHSYQPSRGRIFFEVLCAFGMSAALAGSWVQTGATALAAAASIAALYGLVHFFDMFRRQPVVEVEPQRIDFGTPLEMDPVQVAQVSSAPPVDPAPIVDIVGIEEMPVVEVVSIEPTPPPAKAGRVANAPRKGGSQRKSAPKSAEVAVLTPADEVEGELPALPDTTPGALVAPIQSPVTPLFEPEPFGRQPHRATFGRKVG